MRLPLACVVGLPGACACTRNVAVVTPDGPIGGGNMRDVRAATVLMSVRGDSIPAGHALCPRASPQPPPPQTHTTRSPSTTAPLVHRTSLHSRTCAQQSAWCPSWAAWQVAACGRMLTCDPRLLRGVPILFRRVCVLRCSLERHGRSSHARAPPARPLGMHALRNTLAQVSSARCDIPAMCIAILRQSCRGASSPPPAWRASALQGPIWGQTLAQELRDDDQRRRRYLERAVGTLQVSAPIPHAHHGLT